MPSLSLPLLVSSPKGSRTCCTPYPCAAPLLHSQSELHMGVQVVNFIVLNICTLVIVYEHPLGPLLIVCTILGMGSLFPVLLVKNTFVSPSNFLTVTSITRLRCPVKLSLLFLPLLALPPRTPKVLGDGTTRGRPIYLSALIQMSIPTYLDLLPGTLL